MDKRQKWKSTINMAVAAAAAAADTAAAWKQAFHITSSLVNCHLNICDDDDDDDDNSNNNAKIPVIFDKTKSNYAQTNRQQP